ncbi:heme NO-binding domain-containing protein [Litorisediminicola beolgyonensis]|uniref:Heme NO-binding domain-containing protein n=1 Tax=Litorisediminicola beolgyonensis TaxID=1173614 RepID=A0ABW3ZLJ1_9RHOB
MHGLINRTIQNFVTDSYGAERWTEVTRAANAETADFEPMLSYDRETTSGLVAAMAAVLERTPENCLEDLGTYLVSHPNSRTARRLLRYGGDDFREFLLSLDDLPDRLRLALPDLRLPELEVIEHDAQSCTVLCRGSEPLFAAVLLGVLRAMADDYGALALLQPGSRLDGVATLDVLLVDEAHGLAKSFDLAPARVEETLE